MRRYLNAFVLIHSHRRGMLWHFDDLVLPLACRLRHARRRRRIHNQLEAVHRSATRTRRKQHKTRAIRGLLMLCSDFLSLSILTGGVARIRGAVKFFNSAEIVSVLARGSARRSAETCRGARGLEAAATAATAAASTMTPHTPGVLACF